MPTYPIETDSVAQSGRDSTAVISRDAEERARIILADLCQRIDALREVLGTTPAAPPYREVEAQSRGSRRRDDANALSDPAAVGGAGRVTHRGSGDGSDNGWMTTAEAATYLRKSQSTLAKLRVYGGGPKFYRVGGKSVRYRHEDLDEWASRNSHTNTSEYVG